MAFCFERTYPVAAETSHQGAWRLHPWPMIRHLFLASDVACCEEYLPKAAREPSVPKRCEAQLQLYPRNPSAHITPGSHDRRSQWRPGSSRNVRMSCRVLAPWSFAQFAWWRSPGDPNCPIRSATSPRRLPRTPAGRSGYIGRSRLTHNHRALCGTAEISAME